MGTPGLTPWQVRLSSRCSEENLGKKNLCVQSMQQSAATSTGVTIPCGEPAWSSSFEPFCYHRMQILGDTVG
jgi:hypothetical protein